MCVCVDQLPENFFQLFDFVVGVFLCAGIIQKRSGVRERSSIHLVYMYDKNTDINTTASCWIFLFMTFIFSRWFVISINEHFSYCKTRNIWKVSLQKQITVKGCVHRGVSAGVRCVFSFISKWAADIYLRAQRWQPSAQRWKMLILGQNAAKAAAVFSGDPGVFSHVKVTRWTQPLEGFAAKDNIFEMQIKLLNWHLWK